MAPARPFDDKTLEFFIKGRTSPVTGKIVEVYYIDNPETDVKDVMLVVESEHERHSFKLSDVTGWTEFKREAA